MKEKVRYISADILRGLVIIIMIEVHVFNAFLIPELRQTRWFSVLNFINGLVAPSFLFVSGFAFQVSSRSKLDEMRKFGKVFWKKMGRIFQIIIIGYALHIPVFSFNKMITESTPRQLQNFLAVDILQCIGFGLLFLFITRLLIKSEVVFNFFLIASLVIVTFISSFLWKIEFTNFFSLVFANYFNRMHGSLFPFFPWVNFLLAGAIFAKYFVDALDRNQEAKFVKLFSYTGIVFLLFGHLFFSGLFPQSLTSIQPNPVFYLERLGYILVLFFICWHAAKRFDMKKSFILDASRESLLVYWMHLIIIFGIFWRGKSFADNIGKTMNLFESAAAATLLIFMMIIVAKIWGWAKKDYPKHASIFVIIAAVVLVIIFFIS